MTKNGTVLYRVKQLEKDICSIEDKVDSIMENHLPHIMTALERLEGKVEANKTRIAAFTAFNVGAIIIGILIAKYL